MAMSESRYSESLTETFDRICDDIYMYQADGITCRDLVQRLRESMTLLNARVVTHGRHCRCSACARVDWTGMTVACGMHGPLCPREYAPLNEPLPEVARRG